MKNKKIIIFILGSLIMIGIVGFYAFSNISAPKEKPEEKKVEEGTKEPEIKERIIIEEENFSPDSITIEKKELVLITNKSERKITLVGDKVFSEGKELNKGQGIGFPLESLFEQDIKEISLWLEEKPDKKLNIIIE